jgi:predicted DsbA family dithiol-disulfide isomerase
VVDVVEVDMFSDYICPWCYISTALVERITRGYHVHFRWRAHPLNPDVPDEGILLKDIIKAPPDKVRKMEERLHRAAGEAGLPFCGPEKIYNTRMAQELGAWAATEGRGDVFHHAAYAAYFGDGKDISDPKVLCELAESVGLSPAEAARHMTERNFKSHVDAEWRLSEQMDIVMIPTYLLNENRLVGIQSDRRLARFLENNGVEKRGGETEGTEEETEGTKAQRHRGTK